MLCQGLVQAASARSVDALPPEARPHREGFWAPVLHGPGQGGQAGEKPVLQRRARLVTRAHEVHDDHIRRPEPEAPGCDPHCWDFMGGQHRLRQLAFTGDPLVDQCDDRSLCLVAHPEHEAHACDGPHVFCKRTGLRVLVASVEVLARLDGLAQEAVWVDGRVLYGLGKAGERCLRRATAWVP